MSEMQEQKLEESKTEDVPNSLEENIKPVAEVEKVQDAPCTEKNTGSVEQQETISSAQRKKLENNQENASLVQETLKTEEHKNKQETSWQEKEKLLLQKIAQLEKNKQQESELKTKVNNLERDLQVRTEERENYKNRVHVLEIEIAELKSHQPNTLTQAQQNEVHNIKKQSEEILVKAKGVIFDKTKVIQHQELQIEALGQQVSSLKEVLSITKDLLDIRNTEVKHLQEKMDTMDEKINGEKRRQDLMHQKFDTMVKMNSDLKTEYETQLRLFDELKIKYAERDHLRSLNGNSSKQE